MGIQSWMGGAQASLDLFTYNERISATFEFPMSAENVATKLRELAEKLDAKAKGQAPMGSGNSHLHPNGGRGVLRTVQGAPKEGPGNAPTLSRINPVEGD